MSNSFGYTGLVLKFAVNDKVDTAIIYEEPFGATVTYPMGTGYFASGANAKLNSDSFSAIGRYKIGNGFSAFAGLRQQRLDANAAIPFVAGIRRQPAEPTPLMATWSAQPTNSPRSRCASL